MVSEKKFGVTSDGFVVKKFDDVKSSLQDKAKQQYGSDVDLTPGSPIKLMIDFYGLHLANIWGEMAKCYDSAFIATATDASLDSIGKLVGAERGTGLFATGYITFYRNTPLPPGQPRIINMGTKVSTAMIRSTSYVTTQSVYFQPLITAEEHTVVGDGSYTIETENMIYEIEELYSINEDSSINDYLETGSPNTPAPTFAGRTITFNSQINPGVTIYVTYKPLSVTAPIIAVEKGSDSNVAANTVTIMDTPIDFIHYIGNEIQIDSGADVESDSHFRQKIIGATQAIGKATKTALEFFVGKVTGVKTVLIEDPLKLEAIDTVTGDGSYTVYASKLPMYKVTSVYGSLSGQHIVTSMNINTGEIILDELTASGETLTIRYKYSVPGKIKIYVQGGEVGDENTPDTIVYAIEKTRAAGIQAVGYASDDAKAYGSPTAQFSWFYRPNSADVDIAMTIYFDLYETVTEAERELIAYKVKDAITDYINSMNIEDKIYKSKLIKIAMECDEKIIDAQLTNWAIDEEIHALSDIYIQSGEMEIVSARTVLINQTEV